MPALRSELPTQAQAAFIERTDCINCGSKRLIQIDAGSYREGIVGESLASAKWGENPMPYLQQASWSLVQCEDCSQIFHKRVLDDEWNERRLSKWMSADGIIEFMATLKVSGFERTFRTSCSHVGHILRIERLTRLIRSPKQPVRILDFGCGFGDFLEACAHFGFSVVGVDSAAARRERPKVKIYGSLHEIPDGKFHAITLFEVLEHVNYPAEVLKALYELLEPGGILVLETPDCAGLHRIATPRDYDLANPLDHINCFTQPTLISIAQRCGLKRIKRGPAFVMADPLRVIKRTARHLLGRDETSTQLYFQKV